MKRVLELALGVGTSLLVQTQPIDERYAGPRCVQQEPYRQAVEPDQQVIIIVTNWVCF